MKRSVAEIKAARHARARRHARAADHTLGLCGGGSSHSHRGRDRRRILQWDKARQLQRASEQRRLKNSLNKRQLELDHAQANILAELSGTKLLRGELDSALRLASHGTRIDLALPSDAVKASRPLPRSRLRFRRRIGACLAAMTAP